MGGGFRELFHEECVARFQDGDVFWLCEYYDDDNADP